MFKYNIEEIYYINENKFFLKGWYISSNQYFMQVKINNKFFEIVNNVSRMDVKNTYTDITNDDLLGFEMIFVVDEKINNVDIVLFKDNKEEVLRNYKHNQLKHLKDLNSIIYNIDSIEYLKSDILIKGWCFSKYFDNLEVRINNSVKNYEIKRKLRTDVNRIYNIKNNEAYGFEILLKSCDSLRKVKLSIDDSYNNIDLDLLRFEKKLSKKIRIFHIY